MQITTKLTVAAALVALSAGSAVPALAGEHFLGLKLGADAKAAAWAQHDSEKKGLRLGADAKAKAHARNEERKEDRHRSKRFRHGYMFHGGVLAGTGGLESVRGDFKEMTEEEREEYREDAKTFRADMKASFENFVGLSKEELKEARKDGQTMGEILEDQGKDRDETEDFLTARGEARIDFVDDHHDLSAEDEVTLRARITTWIGKVLDRWFN